MARAKKAAKIQTETVPASEEAAGVESAEAAAPAVEAPESAPEAPRLLTPEEKSIHASREALKHPLDPGQKFFESPEGYIVVGEASRPHVWCRHANHGKGMMIQPRR